MESLRSLVLDHGLAPALHRLGGAFSDAPPATGLQQGWQSLYQGHIVRNVLARTQLREIAAAFAGRGLDLIVVKGGAALVWLYERREARPLVDLDLLVREEQAGEALQALVQLGYQCLASSSSPEYDWMRLRLGEERTFTMPDRLPVEMKINLFHSRDAMAVAVPEVWEAAVQVHLDGVPLRVLAAPHFVLHTAAHFMRHLELNFAPLKGLRDILTVLRRRPEEIDWPAFWAAAERWAILGETGTVMATLNQHWKLDIPGVPPDAVPLSPEVLLHGTRSAAERTHASLPGGYLDRLMMTGELRGFTARLRYLLRLLFPPADNMRFRYNVPEGRSLAVWYVRHPFILAARLARGLAAARRLKKEQAHLDSAAPHEAR